MPEMTFDIHELQYEGDCVHLTCLESLSSVYQRLAMLRSGGRFNVPWHRRTRSRVLDECQVPRHVTHLAAEDGRNKTSLRGGRGHGLEAPCASLSSAPGSAG